ncbi:MAG TPA: hypothetical protein VL853_02725 [Gemmatimonadales bacterium]|nr:hypothetical protein [Gemmatimonadales bacterium]
MPNRLRVFYSVLIASLMFIPATALYRELTMRSDIWWTPAALAVSLPDSKDRVEIYLRGQPLVALVEHKQLSIADGGAPRVVGGQDVKLRFNNWDRIRAARLPLHLIYAAAMGGGIVLLALVATGRLTKGSEREAAAA